MVFEPFFVCTGWFFGFLVFESVDLSACNCMKKVFTLMHIQKCVDCQGSDSLEFIFFLQFLSMWKIVLIEVCDWLWKHDNYQAK